MEVGPKATLKPTQMAAGSGGRPAQGQRQVRSTS